MVCRPLDPNDLIPAAFDPILYKGGIRHVRLQVRAKGNTGLQPSQYAQIQTLLQQRINQRLIEGTLDNVPYPFFDERSPIFVITTITPRNNWIYVDVCIVDNPAASAYINRQRPPAAPVQQTMVEDDEF